MLQSSGKWQVASGINSIAN